MFLGALSVGYGLTGYGRFQGPYPSEFIQGVDGITIVFDNGEVEMEQRADSGFEVPTHFQNTLHACHFPAIMQFKMPL